MPIFTLLKSRKFCRKSRRPVARLLYSILIGRIKKRPTRCHTTHTIKAVGKTVRHSKDRSVSPPQKSGGRTISPFTHINCPSVDDDSNSGKPPNNDGRVKRGTQAVCIANSIVVIRTGSRDNVRIVEIIVIAGPQPGTRKLSPVNKIKLLR